jgi:molybdate transport system substrate-binding protein
MIRLLMDAQDSTASIVRFAVQVDIGLSAWLDQRPMRLQTRLLLVLAGLAIGCGGRAEQTVVAVAANFGPATEAIAAEFQERTGHTMSLVKGSTGGLYAQIVNGAPFDIFIAADRERPRLLEQSGHGVPGSRATVASGRLVLWSRDRELIETQGLDALRHASLRHLAIANPELAPYGEAARQALAAMGLWEALSAKIVRGESIAQTFAMVATRNAELGLVALSQVIGADHDGAYVLIPEGYHEPLRQDVILLRHGADNPAASAALAFLLSPTAKAIIRGFGYTTAD